MSGCCGIVVGGEQDCWEGRRVRCSLRPRMRMRSRTGLMSRRIEKIER